MAICLVEVAPDGQDWIVRLKQEVRGRFASAAQAVSFAQTLCDDLRGPGLEPRVRVYFEEPLEGALAS